MKNWIYIALFIVLSSCSKDTVPLTSSADQNEISDPITPQNVRSFLTDPNATNETVALFYNLRKKAKSQTLIGQQEAFSSFYDNQNGNSDIKKTTGKDPAVLGLDFMFITDKNNTGLSNNWYFQQEQKSIADAKEAFQKGMLITYSWHLREPYLEESFYTNSMTDQQKSTAFRSLLPGGIHHDWFKSKLDKIATIFTSLQVNGTLIPILFRPFHEMDGNWFWWGQSYCSPQEYKSVFQFLVTYLRDVKQVHNVLYVFAPDNSYTQANDYLTRFPGDNFVDVLGMDNYGDFGINQGQIGSTRANEKLVMLSELAQQKNKIAALTETGYQVTSTSTQIPNWFSINLYTALTTQNPNVAYVLFWNNTQNAYYIPTPASGNTTDFIQFSTKVRCVFQPQLQSIYQIQN